MSEIQAVESPRLSASFLVEGLGFEYLFFCTILISYPHILASVWCLLVLVWHATCSDSFFFFFFQVRIQLIVAFKVVVEHLVPLTLEIWKLEYYGAFNIDVQRPIFRFVRTTKPLLWNHPKFVTVWEVLKAWWQLCI